MSEKKPGQIAYQAGKKANVKTMREAFIAIETAVRNAALEEAARAARACFWSKISAERIVSRQASPDEVEAAIRALKRPTE